jgi:hypothetical protein
MQPIQLHRRNINHHTDNDLPPVKQLPLQWVYPVIGVSGVVDQ